MKIDVKVDMQKAKKLIDQLRGPKVKQAMARALTDSAFEARRVVQQQMDTSFNGVTPYVRRSVLVKPATPEKLVAVVEPTYIGGKGVDPQNILRAEIFGGSRKLKRSERALQRAGILPPGYVIVPGEACPLDEYGNVKGSFIVQLISYFRAFGEQGYKANMTDARKKKLRNQQRTERGYLATMGVRYFVSHGRLRANRTRHLPPGIWSAKGVHDIEVRPILMFVRQPSYRKRLDFFGKPVEAAVAKFNPRFRYHMRNILEGKA